MSFRLGNGAWNGEIAIHSNGRTIDVADIRSIWWRRPGPYALPDDLSLQQREFAQEEINQALLGLLSSLDCYWISFPANIRHANHKLNQLKRAGELGFDVPRTIVSTTPEHVHDFYELCGGQMIFKVLTDPSLAAHKVASMQQDRSTQTVRSTPTTLITAAHLQMLDSIRTTPCLFQEYVPKRVELRVTVIGNQVFAAEIHSQHDQSAVVDWRLGDHVRYEAATLPPDLTERCLDLVRSYGLNYSAMDFIVTPDGRYVFIENNPNGQFMWVEKLIPQLEMTTAMATCLIQGSN
jgi:glutathione synthase/RimK-type ligase-like ATP-grasp enzyme